MHMQEVGRPREFVEEEIIANGIEFFRLHGYKQGTMSTLLQYLGLSRQSLYNTFGSKHEFFIKCLTEYRQRTFKVMFSTLLEPHADARDLFKVLKDLSKKLAKEPERNCLIIKSTMELGLNDEAVAGQVHLHSQMLREALINVLMNEKGNGAMNGIGITQVVDMGVSIIYGLHVMARGGADEKALMNSIKAYFNFLNLDYTDEM